MLPTSTMFRSPSDSAVFFYVEGLLILRGLPLFVSVDVTAFVFVASCSCSWFALTLADAVRRLQFFDVRAKALSSTVSSVMIGMFRYSLSSGIAFGVICFTEIRSWRFCSSWALHIGVTT